MSEKKFYTKILLAIMILISSCEVEEEQDYKTLKIYRNTYSKIIVDSTNVFRNSKNNDQLNVEIRYQARASNSDYDSIKWIFPGGIPEKLNNEMEATVVYDKYGAYDAKMVLIKYDTLNYNSVQIIIDSVPLIEEIKIKYKETNWSSYDSYSTPNIWTSIPNTDIIVGRINDIYTDQISIKSNFTGFDEEQLRISFDYKVTLENPMQTDDFTNNQKKMELKIDDFNRFTINKTNDDKYYSAYINVYNKSDFELKFNLFPPLTQTIWELDNSGSVTPFYEYKINEDQSYLINYINQVNTSSATIKYNDFIYGTSDMVNLKLGDTTKIIMPSGQSKIQVTMKDQFPYSYKVYEEDSRVTATSLNFNEYYFRIYIKNLIIEVF
jgi:hypothetical protein